MTSNTITIEEIKEKTIPIEPDSLIIQEIEDRDVIIYEKSKDYSKDN